MRLNWNVFDGVKRALKAAVILTALYWPWDDGLLGKSVAVWAKPMRWLHAMELRFQRISESAGSKLFKIIAGSLSLPFFVLADLYFQVTFNVNQLLIVSLDGKYHGLKFHDILLDCDKFCSGFTPGETLFQAYQRFIYCCHSGSNGGRSCDEWGDIHSVVGAGLKQNEPGQPVCAVDSQHQQATDANSAAPHS